MLLALVLVAFAWLQFAGVVHKHVHTHLQLVASQIDQILLDHSQQDKSDCQLFDLHSSGSALSQALPVLTLPVFSLQTLWHQATLFSSSTRLVYQARAPPKTSI